MPPRKIVSINPKLAKKVARDRRVGEQRDRDAEITRYQLALNHLRKTPNLYALDEITAVIDPIIRFFEARIDSLMNYSRIKDPKV